MELGSEATLLYFGRKPKNAKIKKGKELTKKPLKLVDNLLCNSCKKTTENLKEVVYNYNTNIAKWIASTICKECLNKKSVFVKHDEMTK